MSKLEGGTWHRDLERDSESESPAGLPLSLNPRRPCHCGSACSFTSSHAAACRCRRPTGRIAEVDFFVFSVIVLTRDKLMLRACMRGKPGLHAEVHQSATPAAASVRAVACMPTLDWPCAHRNFYFLPQWVDLQTGTVRKHCDAATLNVSKSARSYNRRGAASHAFFLRDGQRNARWACAMIEDTRPSSVPNVRREAARCVNSKRKVKQWRAPFFPLILS